MLTLIKLFFNQKTNQAILFFLLLLLLLVGKRLYVRYFNPQLTITFFDVGQGDASLIQFPFGHTMLVDAGGGYQKWNIGHQKIYPELSRLGILSLDTMLMSHPDQDHVYGVLGLLEDLSIEQLWVHEDHVTQQKPILVDILKLAHQKKVAIKQFKKIARGTLAGVSYIVFPLHPSSPLHSKTNNQALILHLQFGGCSILFTGDIEREGEAALFKELERVDIPELTLLKVAHHGSHTSSHSFFLQKSHPIFSVISVGEHNPYHHPHKKAVERLKSFDSQVFRTDLHGFLRFTFSKAGRVKCQSGLGDCGEYACVRNDKS